MSFLILQALGKSVVFFDKSLCVEDEFTPYVVVKECVESNHSFLLLTGQQVGLTEIVIRFVTLIIIRILLQ